MTVFFGVTSALVFCTSNLPDVQDLFFFTQVQNPFLTRFCNQEGNTFRSFVTELCFRTYDKELVIPTGEFQDWEFFRFTIQVDGALFGDSTGKEVDHTGNLIAFYSGKPHMMAVVAFKGTDESGAKTDLKLEKVKAKSYYKSDCYPKEGGYLCKFLAGREEEESLHRGFHKGALSAEQIVFKLIDEWLVRKKIKSNDTIKFVTTGHSLGGAIATLFSGSLHAKYFSALTNNSRNNISVITFGAPRVMVGGVRDVFGRKIDNEVWLMNPVEKTNPAFDGKGSNFLRVVINDKGYEDGVTAMPPHYDHLDTLKLKVPYSPSFQDTVVAGFASSLLNHSMLLYKLGIKKCEDVLLHMPSLKQTGRKRPREESDTEAYEFYWEGKIERNASVSKNWSVSRKYFEKKDRGWFGGPDSVEIDPNKYFE